LEQNAIDRALEKSNGEWEQVVVRLREEKEQAESARLLGEEESLGNVVRVQKTLDMYRTTFPQVMSNRRCRGIIRRKVEGTDPEEQETDVDHLERSMGIAQRDKEYKRALKDAAKKKKKKEKKGSKSGFDPSELESEVEDEGGYDSRSVVGSGSYQGELEEEEGGSGGGSY
jgi:hypothetical protein